MNPINIFTREEWRAVVNDGWGANPVSVVARKKGVNRVAIANLPVKASISNSERLANAYLISAAPDLLDALETAPVNGLNWSDDELTAWLMKARSAIDKARGHRE